jgi:hypothetical protein
MLGCELTGEFWIAPHEWFVLYSDGELLNALPFLISLASTLERVWGIESKVNIRTPWPLSQGLYDALASFTYNEGAGRLQSSTLTPGWSLAGS